MVIRLLLPELITQFGELTTLLPSLLGKIRSILASQPRRGTQSDHPDRSAGQQPVASRAMRAERPTASFRCCS